MEGLFLHMDEELTNGRPGRRLADYTPEEIAYLLNVYLILYDRVYIPANFLTDSNMAPTILQCLRVNEPEACIYANGHPFQILWDTSRFESHTFADLVNELQADTDYVTMVDAATAAKTAQLADRHLLGDLVEFRDLSAVVDYRESVSQLRNEVFNPDFNEAYLTSRVFDRLRACLDEIETNLINVPYGRNFFYSVFGHTKRGVQETELTRQFAQLRERYWGIAHEFLTAVDYVSHSLKARFAADALGRQIEALIPKEYLWVISPPGKGWIGQLIEKVRTDWRSPAVIGHRRVVRAMTADNLRDLHESAQYEDYVKACRELSFATEETRDELSRDAERKASTYLSHVSSVLYPKAKHRIDEGLTMVAKAFSGASGASLCILSALGRERGAELVSQAIEVGGCRVVGALREKLVRRSKPPLHIARPKHDVRIYREKGGTES